jgi:tRNA-modifying protein YgfZ
MSDFVDFLKRDTPAKLIDGCAAHFGDPAREFAAAQTAISKYPLLSLGVIAFAGADAQSFINGQFTTDCADITPTHAQFSAWCDPKGRVLFLFTLYTDGERFYAMLVRNQIEDFMGRLRRYILRDDVQLEDLSGRLVLFGSSGESGAGNQDTTRLCRPWDTVQRPDSTIIIRHGPGPSRFVIIGDHASAADRWTALKMPSAGEDTWTALDIYSGLPHLDEGTSGRFLPQHLNLEALNALSFSKGCYPGQEIIARLKYRGEVKKRLLAATFESPADLAPGTPIQTGDKAARTVGHVLYAQRLDPSRSALSAVVEIDAAVEVLIIDGTERPALRRIDLPYAAD